MMSWIGRDIIQTSRECLGGHGYSAYSRLPKLREDHDPALTFEGDNNVLIQQLERFLLKAVQRKQSGKKVSSPFNSLKFLDNIESVNTKYEQNVDQLLNGGYVDSLRWRIVYLLSEAGKKLMAEASSKDPFIAWNDTQVFYLQNAAKAFMEWLIVDRFLEKINSLPGEFQSLKSILLRACDLFALWSLERDMVTYLAGGYFTSEQSYTIKELVLRLTREFKNESVAIIDAIAPPDEIIWSPLGQSNGEIYKNLFNTVRSAPGAFERPSYWALLRTPVQPGSLKAKL
jgi:acyl-CoA oxidase